MTVSAERTLSNAADVNRKIPLSALANPNLANADLEQITGPGPNLTVPLSKRIASVVFLLAHDGAGALEAGGASPAALAIPPLADFSVSLDGQLVNDTARDYSGSQLLVAYQAQAAEDDPGGQSSVTP